MGCAGIVGGSGKGNNDSASGAGSDVEALAFGGGGVGCEAAPGPVVTRRVAQLPGPGVEVCHASSKLGGNGIFGNTYFGFVLGDGDRAESGGKAIGALVFLRVPVAWILQPIASGGVGAGGVSGGSEIGRRGILRAAVDGGGAQIALVGTDAEGKDGNGNESGSRSPKFASAKVKDGRMNHTKVLVLY